VAKKLAGHLLFRRTVTIFAGMKHNHHIKAARRMVGSLLALALVMPAGAQGYLHQGLNVSLGASVFASFGKGSWKGTGFTQNVSAVYADSLSSRLSYTVGGHFSNVMWRGTSYPTASVSASLDYKISDHWDAYVYGQKNLAGKAMPLPLYYMDSFGSPYGYGAALTDKIGAGIRYAPSEKFSVQLNIEKNWMPRRSQGYFAEHDYPVPTP